VLDVRKHREGTAYELLFTTASPCFAALPQYAHPKRSLIPASRRRTVIGARSSAQPLFRDLAFKDLGKEKPRGTIARVDDRKEEVGGTVTAGNRLGKAAPCGAIRGEGADVCYCLHVLSLMRSCWRAFLSGCC
jgi:hypothetical protein